MGIPSLSGCLVYSHVFAWGDEGRNRKERADLTGKSSWTGDSSWLSLPLRLQPGLALPLHHRLALLVREPHPGLQLPLGWELLNTASRTHAPKTGWK